MNKNTDLIEPMQNRVAERATSFRNQIRTGVIRVNVYGESSKSIKSMVLYACIVAGAVLGAVTQDKFGTSSKQYVEIQNSPNFDKRSGSIDVFPTSPEITQGDANLRAPFRDTEQVAPTLNYIDVVHNGRRLRMLDESSRILLVKQVSQQQGLESVGLNWKDLYGLIHAETAWVARDGKGKNGVTSVGLAQMEPNTAKSLNLDNPLDPIQAISGAAVLMKEAAQWSRFKLSGLKLGKHEKNQKIREGISVYYNLSTAGRRAWNGVNTDQMPIETQRHILNTKDGANLAASIEKKIINIRANDAAHQKNKEEFVQIEELLIPQMTA